MPAILAKKIGMTQRFLEDGHALHAPVVEEQLGHAELLGEDRGHQARRISMSTPAGR